MDMNTNSTIYNNYKTYAAEQAHVEKASSKKSEYGKTFGEVKLSEDAAKYYDQLKSKFGNLEFVLVSKDQKANAQAHAAQFATPGKTVVLIDDEKIERMASDKAYREKYENIIANAASGIDQLKSQMEANGLGANVASYGIVIDDKGIASFFATLKESNEAQMERIEKHAQEKREERAEERKEKVHEKEREILGIKDYNSVTIQASSIEELMQKIGDYTLEQRSNNVQTEQEMQLGQHIDFRG